MRLKVSSTNWYVGNKQPATDAHFWANLNCDIGGIQEGNGGNAEDIRKALNKTHHVFWGESKDTDKAHAMRDVPVVYRKSLTVIREWARQINARSEKKNIGMARAATAVRFEKQGHTITFINTHTNAAVQGRNPEVLHLSTKIKRVAAYVAGMIVLEIMIRNAQRRGDLVVLTGDLNYMDREGVKKVWKFSPEGLFDRNGLHYRTKGVDYIAFSKKFHPENFTWIGPNRTGTDTHNWLTLDLTTPL